MPSSKEAWPYDLTRWLMLLKQRVDSIPLVIGVGDITGGAALTRTNDTNITLTLTGSPTTALLAATNIAAGWTGVLGVARGGTGTGTAFTAGSVVFAGPAGVYAQDNANFFWDDANNRLGVGTATPSAAVDVLANGTAHIFMGDAGILNYAAMNFNGDALSNSTYNFLSSPSDKNLYINRPSGSAIHFRETNSTEMVITSPSGFVGLGITGTTVDSRLHVFGNSTGGDTVIHLQNTSATADRSVQFDLDASAQSANARWQMFTGSPTLLAGAATTMFFRNRNAGINVLMLTSAGLIGAGVAAPTAIVHLKAGATAASSAPLKFNSGSLMTTAEAGAVEFLTDAYYGTITTGAARKTFAFLESPAFTTPDIGAATGASLALTSSIGKYKNVNTAGWGVPAIQAEARSTAQTAAVASVAAYTCGAADGSFLVSANVNVTTSTAHSFTAECAYTDETNTARVLTLPVIQLAGTIITAITNVTGAGPYEGVATHIRCKASTAITIRTQAAGTYTTVVFNVEGLIQQVA